MYLASTEIRWFRPGQIPQDVLHWFAHARDVSSEPAQTHEYLRMPGCTSVGVKLRNQLFEIKARQSDSKLLELPGENVGWCDGWLKWSTDRAFVTDASPLNPITTDDAWVQIRKERRLLWMQAEAHIPVRMPTIRPLAGCAAELTAIQVNNTDWWTLCFEAIGPGNVLTQILTDCASAFLLDRPFPDLLSANESFAYPMWITRFVEAHNGREG